MLFGFYLLSLFAIRTQVSYSWRVCPPVSIFYQLIFDLWFLYQIFSLQIYGKKVFATIAKTRLKGLSDKV